MKAYAKTSRGRSQTQRLMTEHMDVARRIALRVARRVPDWLSAEDLISAAMVGLAEAAERFDPTRGQPFVAFAERRIRGAVFDELRRGDIMPRRVRSLARRIGSTLQELEQRHGRSPEDAEVAEALDISLSEYQESLKMLNHVSLVDLDAVPTAAVQLAAGGMLSPVDAAERSELLRLVREALPRLQPRDAQLLSLYYNEELTYMEIADLFGVSESRICQLHSRAIARLRAEIENPSAAPAAAPALDKVA